jgi:hypothetical protein
MVSSLEQLAQPCLDSAGAESRSFMAESPVSVSHFSDIDKKRNLKCEILCSFRFLSIILSMANTWESLSMSKVTVGLPDGTTGSGPTFATAGTAFGNRDPDRGAHELLTRPPATESLNGTMGGGRFRFYFVIEEISAFPWSSLSRDDMVDVARAYYFFSIQFRENLEEARRLYPDDENLRQLEEGECDTDNLSPWPNVAAAGERLNHDEYMRRALALMPCSAAKAEMLKAIGDRYLAATRSQPSCARAASLVSYEDGGLERVFRAMLTFEHWDTELLLAFRHFLQKHVDFDGASETSHGALCRHIHVDDSVLPLWLAFRDLLVEAVPAISRAAGRRLVS